MTMLQAPGQTEEAGVPDLADTLLNDVVVTEVEDLARGVIGLTLRATRGGHLPAWEPGAHIDLILPSGLVRQYSLCGDPADPAYRVAILREADGRGGSEEAHAVATAGLGLRVRGPRNHFPFFEADSYLFVAGGIGITPMIPMLKQAAASGAEWCLVYGGRSLETMAYAEDLKAFGGHRVTIVPEDTDGLPNLDALLDGLGPGMHVYACGPNSLLDALQERCTVRGISDRLHLERFGAAPGAVTTPIDGDQAFELELAQTGVTIQVAADQSIYDAVQEYDTDLLFSCSEGYCGTCEVKVLGGTPLHRDTVASPEEHEEDGSMIICVGRAKSARLVIDA